jgi:transcription elongation factor Elf1
MDEYNQLVESLVEKVPDKGYRCIKCGYSHLRKATVNVHVETQIFTTSLTCKFCDMKLNSKVKLQSRDMS